MDEIQRANSNPADGRDGRCLNCGAELFGPYCHACGQKVLPPNQTFGELLSNFISSFWSYEGKFWTTIKYLLFRPGLLAKDYVEGKRERYFHPARMYVFISFIFFIVLALMPDREYRGPTRSQTGGDSEVKSFHYESLGLRFRIDNSYKSVAHYDSLQAQLPESERDKGFKRWMDRKEIELFDHYENQEEFQHAFSSTYTGNVSKVFFWLLPVFALLLKLFFRKSRRYYVQHLVFTVYLYDFFFLVASVLILLGYVTGLPDVSNIVLFVILVAYFVLALRRMYEESWVKIVIKTVLFLFVFTLCTSLGLFVNFVVALALI